MNHWPKLSAETGDGVRSASVMTASNMMVGQGAVLDQATCQCVVVGEFLIATNQALGKYSRDLLSELYGPLVVEILGTKTDEIDILRQRAFQFADSTIRRLLPRVLHFGDHSAHAQQLESLPTIESQASACFAFDHCRKIAGAVFYHHPRRPIDVACIMLAHAMVAGTDHSAARQVYQAAIDHRDVTTLDAMLLQAEAKHAANFATDLQHRQADYLASKQELTSVESQRLFYYSNHQEIRDALCWLSSQESDSDMIYNACQVGHWAGKLVQALAKVVPPAQVGEVWKFSADLVREIVSQGPKVSVKTTLTLSQLWAKLK